MDGETPETTELVEVLPEETAGEPEPEPETPETVIGLIHEQGQTAAEVRNLEEDVDDLRAQVAALRAEVPGMARTQAEALLEEIIQEQAAAEGETAAEHPSGGSLKWWEKLLAGH